MSVQHRIRTGDDVINGQCTIVLPTGHGQYYDGTPPRSHHLPPSGTTQEFDTLNGRYLHDPSGWSE